MKKSLSLGIAVLIAFSVILPNAWATSILEQNQQLFFKKVGKALNSFSIQLRAYSEGKNAIGLERFYSELSQKLTATEVRLSAQCWSDKAKEDKEWARYLKSGKAGPCVNKMLMIYFKEVAGDEREIARIMDGFDTEMGRISITFLDSRSKPGDDLEAIDAIYNNREIFNIRFFWAKKGDWKNSNCRISKPFKDFRHDFAYVNGRLTSKERFRMPDGKETEIDQKEDHVEIIKSDWPSGLSRDQALKHWKAKSAGKWKYGWGWSQEGMKSSRLSGGGYVELVRFENFNYFKDEEQAMNLWLLYCDSEMPYPGEW